VSGPVLYRGSRVFGARKPARSGRIRAAPGHPWFFRCRVLL